MTLNSNCWEWTRYREGGYGRLKRHGRHVLAHRFFYETCFGPVPAGLDLDHLCRNRWCVNPDHLEPVTRRENVLRGAGLAAMGARKTHCDRGHELPALTRARRICAECRRMRYRGWYHRHKGGLDDRRII